MALWQINIERKNYAAPVDMDAIRTACADLIDGIEQLSGQGHELDEAVMVAAGNVGKAVERINALGYATDEDDA
jgi:hypothetical protein